MKNFRKITLGILLSAQVLGAFYGCSSESMSNVENELFNNQSELAKRTNLSDILSKDMQFLMYLEESEKISNQIDINILRNISIEDKTLSSEKYDKMVKAFGFSQEKEFEVFMKSYFSRIQYLKDTYSWDKMSKEELSKLLIDAIDLSVITNNEHCKKERTACRSNAANEYTQNVLGCAGAGVLISSVSGGTMTLLGAGVALACVGQAAYNLNIEIDLCEAEYKKCIKK